MVLSLPKIWVLDFIGDRTQLHLLNLISLVNIRIKGVPK